MCPSSDVRAEAAATVSPLGKSCVTYGIKEDRAAFAHLDRCGLQGEDNHGQTIEKRRTGSCRSIRFWRRLSGRFSRGSTNTFVFAGTKPGERQNDLPKGWERFLAKAGIVDFHWHDLRHTFASRLVMKGVDLYKVMKLLGHHDFKMTERYAHLSPKYLREAVDVPVETVAPLP